MIIFLIKILFKECNNKIILVKILIIYYQKIILIKVEIYIKIYLNNCKIKMKIIKY